MAEPYSPLNRLPQGLRTREHGTALGASRSVWHWKVSRRSCISPPLIIPVETSLRNRFIPKCERGTRNESPDPSSPALVDARCLQEQIGCRGGTRQADDLSSRTQASSNSVVNNHNYSCLYEDLRGDRNLIASNWVEDHATGLARDGFTPHNAPALPTRPSDPFTVSLLPTWLSWSHQPTSRIGHGFGTSISQ